MNYQNDDLRIKDQRIITSAALLEKFPATENARIPLSCSQAIHQILKGDDDRLVGGDWALSYSIPAAA